MSNFEEVKSQTLIYIYDSFFKDYIFKTKNDSELEKFYEQINDIVPKESVFFENWFRAFVAVSKNDGQNSKDYFLKALENVSLVPQTNLNLNNYIPTFLQQGFAFFMYISDFENAKKFWEEGASRNFFVKEDTADFYEKFFKRFNSKEEFWVQFSPKMFIDEEKAREKAISNYKENLKSDDEILNSVNDADFAKFDSLTQNIDFGKYKLSGTSILYYALQRKNTLKAGSEKFVEDLVQLQVKQMVSRLNISSLPENLREQQYLEIYHQIRVTYEKSGLGKIMFNAFFCRDEELDEKLKNMQKILEKAIEKTSNVDAFTKDAGNKTQTNALLLCGELGDIETMQKLIEKGANVEKPLGFANFGMRYRDGKSISTSIPNSLIYRMITFAQYDAIKFYLSNFKEKARKSMTEKSKKCDITPLTYLILNTIYNSKSEEDYKKSKDLVDSLLPLFTDAGASLDENTAFGSAKKLLGM